MSSYITTYTGKHVDPLNPDMELICIADIAHALSLICRGNGHVRTFWSVGQHCICCAKEAAARGLPSRMVLACLLHDASECYMSDVPRPFKKELHDYQEREKQLLSQIYVKFLGSDLTEDEQEQLKGIDNAMLWYDLENLLGELQYGEIPDIHIELNYSVRRFTDVEDEYLSIFSEYSGTETPRPIYLEDIVDAFDACMDEWGQYLDCDTGKIITISTSPDFVTEQDTDTWNKIEEGDNYIRLPNQYELHEKGIMEEFADSLDDKNLGNILLNALHRAHPYRRFKDLINQYGCAQDYYKYRAETFLQIAEEWCNDNSILYRKGSKNKEM